MRKGRRSKEEGAVTKRSTGVDVRKALREAKGTVVRSK
jgi:hypothetical protein